jgi:tRNA A37 threonylcarbamoyladenosine biosynthesis protein TsaE
MPSPVIRRRRDSQAVIGQPALRVAARHALSVLVNVAEPGRGIDRDLVFAAVRHWYAENMGERQGLADDFEEAPPRKRATARERGHLVDALRGLAEAGGKPARGRRGLDGIGRLVRILGLGPLDAQILRMVVLYSTNRMFEELVDALATRVFRSPPSLRADPSMFALLTGATEDELTPRLRRNGDLAASGVIRVADCGTITLLSRVLGMAGLTEDTAVIDAILGRKLDATLELADFGHLGADVERVRRILAGALAAGEGGCILFAGVSGAGKTELAKALAAALGTPIYAIGQQDMRGNEPSAAERLSDLALAQRLFAKSRGGHRALLLVDEAEDLWGGVAGSAFDMGMGEFPDLFEDRNGRVAGNRSRAYLHALLEQSTVPMILTCNDIGALGGTPFLRRMTCVISFGVPPLSVRRRLVASAAAAEGMHDMGSGQLEALARMEAGPGVARSALRAARLAQDPEIAIWAATGVAQAMRGSRHPGVVPTEPADGFDPSLISADTDLAALADRLADSRQRHFSMLLSGPAGCGKSAYARYVANRIGMPILERRASDLLSKWVGGSEKLIAAAFAEAVEKDAVLIFDEADSLLGARSGAEHNHEVTRVNELLTWLERHRLPFVATTNFLDNIDGAAMRRFLFKAKFDFIDVAQRVRAFIAHFDVSPPAGLEALDGLTPADFALVKRRSALEGFAGDPAALLAALAAEQAAKPERRHRTAAKIGFIG